jgi:hypothetical protein
VGEGDGGCRMTRPGSWEKVRRLYRVSEVLRLRDPRQKRQTYIGKDMSSCEAINILLEHLEPSFARESEVHGRTSAPASLRQERAT